MGCWSGMWMAMLPMLAQIIYRAGLGELLFYTSPNTWNDLTGSHVFMCVYHRSNTKAVTRPRSICENAHIRLAVQKQKPQMNSSQPPL